MKIIKKEEKEEKKMIKKLVRMPKNKKLLNKKLFSEFHLKANKIS